MLRPSRTWPFLLAILLVYLAPATIGLVMTMSGESPDRAALIARAAWSYLALLINPVACMVIGFFAGWKQGKVWLVPVLAAALSVPFSLQFVGTSPAAFGAAAVYFAIYLVFGVLGWLFGWQINRRQTLVED